MKILLKNNRGGALIKTIHKDQEVFITKGQGLYAWVTESQYKLMKHKGKDPIKFGQYGTDAKGGSTPQTTIQSYKWINEPIIILWAHRLTEQERKFGNAKKIERLMQNHIGPRQIEGDSTEVFFTSIKKIESAFSDIVYNTKNKAVYAPLERQQEAINKMTRYFRNGGGDFLLNAIMRYGKNFTFLTASKQLVKSGGNILVLTNKPGVFDSLQKDIEGHVYFKDWEFFKLKDVKDKTNLKLSPTKVSVIAISKQLADNEVSGKAVRKFMKQTKFDTALFDECHSGTNTENFSTLEKILNVKYKVFASGTPFKTIASRAYTNDNTYSYGYIEQQKDKKAGLCPDAVTLENYIVSVDEEFITNPNFIEEESFSITKLLAVNSDGEFIFGGEVRSWLEDVLGVSPKKKDYSPFRICGGKLDHTVWLVPSDVKAAEALGRMIENITDDYKVLVASGANTTQIKEVHDAIEMNQKTITITNMRFIEGTTVPKWTGAFVLCDTESIEKYFQFIFRVATPDPDKNKDKAFVFDFSPERSYQMLFEFANAQAINTSSTDSQAMIKEWLDNYNIYRAGSGPQLVKVSVEDILDTVRNGDYRAATLKLSVNKYINIDSILSVADIFGHMNIKNNVNKMIEAHSNGLTKGKNYTVTRNSNNSEKLSSLINDAKKNIANIIAAFPLLSFLYGYNTIEDIYQNCSDEDFYECTKVTKPVFSQLLQMIDTRFINLYL